jgi:hypothetical protein
VEGQLSYYDLVAHVVPGTLVLGVLALVPSVFGFTVPLPRSDAVTLAAGLPVTYAVGQVVQAVSSLLQPLYYRLWGGMPSTVILEGRSTRLQGTRLRVLVDGLADPRAASVDTPEARRALFSSAMAVCNRHQLGRVGEFNASYAFHRALLTTGVLTSAMLAIALVLSELGVDSATSALRPGLVYLLVLALALTAIEFVRARQRGEYFAIEVLDMAYVQSLEGSATPTTGVEGPA